MTQADVHERRARPGANKEVLVRPTQCRNPFEQAQFLQDAGCIWPEHHPRPYFSKFGRPLVDCCFDPCAMQRDGRRNAADAAPNNTNIQFFDRRFRGFVIKK